MAYWTPGGLPVGALIVGAGKATVKGKAAELWPSGLVTVTVCGPPASGLVRSKTIWLVGPVTVDPAQ